MASRENFDAENRFSTRDLPERAALSSQLYADRNFNHQLGNAVRPDVSSYGFPSSDSLLRHFDVPDPGAGVARAGSLSHCIGQAFDETRDRYAYSDQTYWQDFRHSLDRDLKGLPEDVRQDVHRHFLDDARQAWKDHGGESGQLDSVDGFFQDLKQRTIGRVSDDLNRDGGSVPAIPGDDDQGFRHRGKHHWHHGGHNRFDSANGYSDGSIGSDGPAGTTNGDGRGGSRGYSNSGSSGITGGDGSSPATAGTGGDGSSAAAGSRGNQSIVENAQSDVGKAMWTKYSDTQNGVYGCAASVSEVLQQSGYSYANSESVVGLQQQLQANGWTATTTPQPGDVVLGYRTNPGNSGGAGAHTGIVGPDGTVFNNVYGSETWQATALSGFNNQEFPAGVVYLHPPA